MRRVTVPCESDSGAVGGKSRGSRDSGERSERYDRQGCLFLRTLLVMPSVGKDGCKGNDRDSESARGDLPPALTRTPGATRFDLAHRNYYRLHSWLYRSLQFTDKSISASGQRLDKAGTLG